MKPTGGFAVWQDNAIDRQDHGIGALRLDAGWQAAAGAPVRVNVSLPGDQTAPQVALLTNGCGFFVWQSAHRGSIHVQARVADAAGVFKTGELRVNAPSRAASRVIRTNVHLWANNKLILRRLSIPEKFSVVRAQNRAPAVAALPDGGAVVVYSGARRWQTNTLAIVPRVTLRNLEPITNDTLAKVSMSVDWMQDIFLQRYNAAGRRVGDEVLVNQWAAFNQRTPAVAVQPDGGFVVVWASEVELPGVAAPEDNVDIVGRLFSASGAPVGDEFVVNTESRVCGSPAVSALSDGRFTVAWSQRDLSRANGWDVQARVFRADGAPEASAFRLNMFTSGAQHTPTLASAGVNQLAVWTSVGQDGSFEGVYAQPLSDGAPVGVEFRVNTTTHGKQIHPVAASDGAARFLVGWTDYAAGTSYDLFGQRFLTTQPPPAPLASTVGGGGAAPGSGGTLAESSAAGIGPAAVSGAGLEAGGLRVRLTGPPEKLRLEWTAVAGVRYQVQSSPDLRSWSNLGAGRVAAGASDSIGVDPGSPAAFYRVLRLP